MSSNISKNDYRNNEKCEIQPIEEKLSEHDKESKTNDEPKKFSNISKSLKKAGLLPVLILCVPCLTFIYTVQATKDLPDIESVRVRGESPVLSLELEVRKDDNSSSK